MSQNSPVHPIQHVFASFHEQEFPHRQAKEEALQALYFTAQLRRTMLTPGIPIESVYDFLDRTLLCKGGYLFTVPSLVRLVLSRRAFSEQDSDLCLEGDAEKESWRAIWTWWQTVDTDTTVLEKMVQLFESMRAPNLDLHYGPASGLIYLLELHEDTWQDEAPDQYRSMVGEIFAHLISVSLEFALHNPGDLEGTMYAYFIGSVLGQPVSLGKYTRMHPWAHAALVIQATFARNSLGDLDTFRAQQELLLEKVHDLVAQFQEQSPDLDVTACSHPEMLGIALVTRQPIRQIPCGSPSPTLTTFSLLLENGTPAYVSWIGPGSLWELGELGAIVPDTCLANILSADPEHVCPIYYGWDYQLTESVSLPGAVVQWLSTIRRSKSARSCIPFE